LIMPVVPVPALIVPVVPASALIVPLPVPVSALIVPIPHMLPLRNCTLTVSSQNVSSSGALDVMTNPLCSHTHTHRHTHPHTHTHTQTRISAHWRDVKSTPPTLSPHTE